MRHTLFSTIATITFAGQAIAGGYYHCHAPREFLHPGDYDIFVFGTQAEDFSVQMEKYIAIVQEEEPDIFAETNWQVVPVPIAPDSDIEGVFIELFSHVEPSEDKLGLVILEDQDAHVDQKHIVSLVDAPITLVPSADSDRNLVMMKEAGISADQYNSRTALHAAFRNFLHFSGEAVVDMTTIEFDHVLTLPEGYSEELLK